MSNISEISQLFTRLALKLHRNCSQNDQRLISEEEEDEYLQESTDLALAISSLNKSLNLNTNALSSSSSYPRVRVLERALSLMCFKAPHLFNSSIDSLIDAIFTVLSSSISCKVYNFASPEHQSMHIGSSISSSDCSKFLESCYHVLNTLHSSGIPHYKLLCAVIKVATSACPRLGLAPSSVSNEDSSFRKNSVISNLSSLMPEETSTSLCETPLRLLFWYLDPLTLKADISRILKEMLERPFLCLKKELYDRMVWRSIVICLVTSPAMFIETRALLHGWFLLTGLASLIELCSELISSALDLLSRPMWWGLPLEWGTKLPFSHSYFPSIHRRLLTKLSGTISCDNFLDIVHLVTVLPVQTKKHLDLTCRSYNNDLQTLATEIIDHNSIWAILMDFPAWFYFAVMLLFWGKPFTSLCDKEPVEIKHISDSKISHAAARYIAKILSPFDEVLYDQLISYVTESSDIWNLQKIKASNQKTHCYAEHCITDISSCWKKLKKPRNSSSCMKNYNVHVVEHWLKDFHLRYVQSHTHEAKNSFCNSMRPNLLFRTIPLGILIGGSSSLDDIGNELLLHYAATGEILQSREAQYARPEYIDDYPLFKWLGEDEERKGAMAGASFVFKLSDTVEDMSSSMCESETSQGDFVCEVKRKVVRYLVMCIKKLLELPCDEGRVVMFIDLRCRLERWREQGREIFEGYEALTNVVHGLNLKILSSVQA